MKSTNGFFKFAVWAPVAAAGLLALSVVLALAQTESQTPHKTPTWNFKALASVPAKARARRNPLAGDPDAVAAGRKLFQQHCSDCHGKDARGGKRGPGLHTAAGQEPEPGALFFVLTNGVIRRGMPDWSKLPEPERWQIVSFLESLQR